MAIGHVKFESWLTIQVPLIVSHDRCTVSLKQWEKFRGCLQFLGLTVAKDYQNNSRSIAMLFLNRHENVQQLQ